MENRHYIAIREKKLKKSGRKFTLNKGFSCFWSAELKEVFKWFKSGMDLHASLKTTAITSCSGPPPESGTPNAAVSRMLLSTPLQMRSISMELTWITRWTEELLNGNAHRVNFKKLLLLFIAAYYLKECWHIIQAYKLTTFR